MVLGGAGEKRGERGQTGEKREKRRGFIKEKEGQKQLTCTLK